MTNFYGISKTELKAVMTADAKLIASDTEKYLKANEDRYDVLCNTWLLMCYDLCGSEANRVLLNAIKREGLINIIDECSKIASRAIESQFEYLPDSPLRALLTEDPKATLQVLRYPKRFSPARADKLQKQTLDAFIEKNNECRRLNEKIPVVIKEGAKIKRHMPGDRDALFVRKEDVLEWKPDYPQWLIKGVRRYLYEIIGEIAEDEDEAIEGSFSSGVSAEGCKTLGQKVRAYAAFHNNYKGCVLYPLHRSDSLAYEKYVKAVPVPKNYKVARIIGETCVDDQFHQQGLRKIAKRHYEKSKYADLIVLDDQSINQEWARLGSIYGVYCTLDVTAASDSISQSFANEVVHPSWLTRLEVWNPKVIKVKYPKIGKQPAKQVEIVRHIFQTSGNGSTFDFESAIFLAVLLFAEEVVTVYEGKPIPRRWIGQSKRMLAGPKRGNRKNPIRHSRVFGDDIVIDPRIYDTVIDFLEMLGFTVNRDKSFDTSTSYKESCGAEWWCGLDVATKYFPRKSLDEATPEYLESLISLQHRLWQFPTAEYWLSRHIRSIAKNYGIKDLTSSEPGTDCDDLWERYPYCKVMNPPYERNQRILWPGVTGVDPIEITPNIAEVMNSGYYAKYPIVSPTTPEIPKEWMRELHTTLKTSYPKQGEEGWISPYGHTEIFLEMIKYADFLQYGPSYDEYGISIPPRSVELECQKGYSEYVISKR